MTEGAWVRLRVGAGPEGDDFFPTDADAREAELAAKEAALAQVKALAAKLRRLEGKKRR